MQVLFIVNEAAGHGKGKKVWYRLQQHLTINYEVAFTEYEGHGQELAKNWAQDAQTKKLIVIVGGDGTIHEVVSGIVHNKFIVIGVVRAGSGNDFARYFTTFKNASQIESYLSKEMASLPMDVGTVQFEDLQQEIFVNNAGVGFDAYVTKRINKSRLKFYLNKIGLGKLSYAAAVVRGLFSFKCFNVTIRTGNQEWQFQQAWFVAMSNQPFFGGGMKISPSSKPDDEQIEITIVHGISRLKLLLVFVTVFFEKHTKFKEITFLQGNQFTIFMHEDDVDCHTDGNYIGEIKERTRIHCAVQRNAWQVKSEENIE
ncbi:MULTISPECIES: diacylglycerol kinase family protein [unclassified Lysinibacillus]|uniref:diacylglycerol/lipid kinase family protein n=1 Tax=unclassified Lysinibacillus TaxID=2636778 RepID=UPI0020118865|nr:MULTISPECIES: diacylglycerol kinase family protein [unclassified Lysinibacillus]MCL1695306.1 diacylglycerol kinase family lipid kinase [Lysinibacillus sp. BPa_S21]MCL1701015.1 diacylglycerol kinase family lipid kinase [Lysinibacillus sp. Bpr_S20]